MKKQILNWVLFAVVPFAMVGCGGGEEAANNTPNETNPAGNAAVETPNGTAQQNSQALTAPPADAAPEVVTKVFLQALIAGNKDLTAELLTKVSREIAAQQKRFIDPSGANASFNVGSTRFVSGPLGGAYVTAELIEEGVANKAEWILRQQPEGWRVAGVQYFNPETQETSTIDFENAAHMAMFSPEPETQPAGNQPAGTQATLNNQPGNTNFNR